MDAKMRMNRDELLKKLTELDFMAVELLF